jgi:hypothetical protein
MEPQFGGETYPIVTPAAHSNIAEIVSILFGYYVGDESIYTVLGTGCKETTTI